MPTATLTIEGLSPLTQSRQHGEDRLASEVGNAGADTYERRTWKNKNHIDPETRSIAIPASGFKFALASGARYSKEQIPGQGKATWTKKFEAGVAIYSDIVTDALEDSVYPITIQANTDGMRGSGKRVPRIFPQIAKGWKAQVEIDILDPIITEELLVRMTDLAGKYVGVGQYRPENGGTNGRFRVVDCQWQED
jgi:hypothetical protein